MVLGDVWLDFDPAAFVTTGLDVDDDLAFLVLLALQNRGHLNLVGVSVVAGNAALRDTLDNARRLLRYAGIDLEPAAGASWRDVHVPWPWVRRLHQVRGDVASSPDAAAAMRAEILARPPQTLTIIALGPLTNIAAVLRDDAVAGRVRRVVYGRRDPAHGGLGSVESVHTLSSTNHRFRAWRHDPDWRLVDGLVDDD